MRFSVRRGKKCSSFQNEQARVLSCTLVRFRRNLETLKSTQKNQKENGMNWQKKLRRCTLCINFKNGELKKRGANMHFNADNSHVKMMMDRISSANDFCIVFGICDYLGKINEIDLES